MNLFFKRKNLNTTLSPSTDPIFIQNNNRKQIPKRKVFAISFSILIILFTYIAALFALNYFRIVNFSAVSPIFDNLPRSPYEFNDLIQNYKKQQSVQEIQSLGDNMFSTEGKITDFGENNIKVKTAKGTILDLELNADTNIRKVSKDGHSTFMFTSDLLQKENIGKNVTIQFIKTKGVSILDNKNILNNIEINN